MGKVNGPEVSKISKEMAGRLKGTGIAACTLLSKPDMDEMQEKMEW